MDRIQWSHMTLLIFVFFESIEQSVTLLSRFDCTLLRWWVITTQRRRWRRWWWPMLCATESDTTMSTPIFIIIIIVWQRDTVARFDLDYRVVPCDGKGGEDDAMQPTSKQIAGLICVYCTNIDMQLVFFRMDGWVDGDNRVAPPSLPYEGEHLSKSGSTLSEGKQFQHECVQSSVPRFPGGTCARRL